MESPIASGISIGEYAERFHTSFVRNRCLHGGEHLFILLQFMQQVREYITLKGLEESERREPANEFVDAFGKSNAVQGSITWVKREWITAQVENRIVMVSGLLIVAGLLCRGK